MRCCVFLSALLLSVSASAALRWQADGTVRDERGKALQSGLTAVTTALETPEGLFLAGQVPHTAEWRIAFLRQDLSGLRAWPLHAPPRQFFRYQGDLYLHDMEGTVYQHTADGWPVADWRVPPASHILQPDADREIIVCTPAPMSKQESGRRHGACYARQAGWQQALDWWPDIPPRLCGDALVVLGWQSAQRQLFHVGLSDGAVQSGPIPPRKALRPTLDLCALPRR